MSDSKKSVQDVKTVDFQELNSIKSELDSKIKEVNELLKLAQDKGVYVDASSSTVVFDDSLLTEHYYTSIKVNLSLQI